MSEKRKLPIDRPCSACSAGDTEMEYHDHHPPFREPVASPQATRPERVLLDELGKLEHRQLRDEHGREIKGALWVKLHDVAGMIGRWAAQPAAGTTPRVTCNAHEGVHPYNVECKSPYESSEGTTPQAEPEIKPHSSQIYTDLNVRCLCGKQLMWRYLEERDEIEVFHCLEARAVAPVETPEKMRPPFEDLCDRCITGTHCIVNGCCLAETRATAPAQTRLTAEQFYDAHREFEHVPTLARKHFFEFAEAFRDKSEAELRFQLAAEQTSWKEGYDRDQAEIRGLREEIERLKEGERLLRDFLERDYGVSEITTICSRYDDAEQELTELRAKLAEQERENAELLEDIQAEYEATDKAEAEAAALRERERWIPWGERMPNPNHRVQILMESGIVTVGAWSGVEWFDGDESFSRLETYGWKALSAAPERGKDGKS